MASMHGWLRAKPQTRHANDVNRKTYTARVAENPDCTAPEVLLNSSRSQEDRRRVPAGLCPSSRSSKGSLDRTEVSLSPVESSGATTFSSVASALDFQHHLGTDPAAELVVLKCILLRECLLSRLQDVCSDIRRRGRRHTAVRGGPGSALGESAQEIMKLLSRMREATSAVIEAVTLWREDVHQHPPPAFLWYGENYLLKIVNDLNFLTGVEPLPATLKKHPTRFFRNPLMLPKTLDEQRRLGKKLETSEAVSSPRLRKRRHLYFVAQVLLNEEDLEGKREKIPSITAEHPRDRDEAWPTGSGRHDQFQLHRGRQDGTGRADARHSSVDGAHVLAHRTEDLAFAASEGESTIAMEPAINDDEFRRKQQLSTWYDEARSQLVSLSRNPADEEYFLHSRRFWSKRELGDHKGVGNQSPPPPRRSLVLERSKRCALGESVSEGGGIYHEAAVCRQNGFGRDRKGWLETRPRYVDLYGQDAIGAQRGSTHHGTRLRSRGADVAIAHGGGIRWREDNDGHKIKVEADVWGRAEGDDCDWAENKPASLASLSAQEVQILLKEDAPLSTTTAICAAVVFLLTPDDQVPEDFHWPQGFEAVALPVEDFLRKLREISGRIISSFKSRVLKFVMQRQDMLPAVIERQGKHTVACLCAWVLEELRACKEFDNWSPEALEAWYKMQRSRARTTEIQDTSPLGPGVTLLYKSLHRLTDVDSSCVISIFKDINSNETVFVRAFDPASSEAFWLTLSAKQMVTFGENATRSPAHLAAALARRLKVKSGGAKTNSRRLIMPRIKAAELQKNTTIRSQTKRSRIKARGGHTEAGGALRETPPPLATSKTKLMAVSRSLRQARRSKQAYRSFMISRTGSRTDDVGLLGKTDGSDTDDTQSEDKKGEMLLESAADIQDHIRPVPFREPKTEERESCPLNKTERAPCADDLGGKDNIILRKMNKNCVATLGDGSEMLGEGSNTERQPLGTLKTTKVSEENSSQVYADDFVDDRDGRADAESGRHAYSRKNVDAVTFDTEGPARGSFLGMPVRTKYIPSLSNALSYSTEKAAYLEDLFGDCAPTSPVSESMEERCAAARKEQEERKITPAVVERSEGDHGRDEGKRLGGAQPVAWGTAGASDQEHDEHRYDLDEEEFEEDDCVESNDGVLTSRAETPKPNNCRELSVDMDVTDNGESATQNPFVDKREIETRVLDKPYLIIDKYTAALRTAAKDPPLPRWSCMKMGILEEQEAVAVSADVDVRHDFKSNVEEGRVEGPEITRFHVQPEDARQETRGRSSLEITPSVRKNTGQPAVYNRKPATIALNATLTRESSSTQGYLSEFEEPPSDDPSDTFDNVSSASDEPENRTTLPHCR